MNIFFIDRFPFVKEFYLRNEFEKLKNAGANVKFLDISKFLKRKVINNTIPEDLLEYVVPFNSKSEFYDFLNEQAKNTIIVSTVPYIESSGWMYYYIFKHDIPYVLIENASFHIPTSTPDKKNRRLKFIARLNWKKTINKPAEIRAYILSMLRKKPAKMLITSMASEKSSLRKLCGHDTEHVYVVNPDYKVALTLKESLEINEEFAVFIDQYFCHHPDFKTNRILHSFTSNEYYAEINQFLKTFSENTGLKVVIASHPRRQLEHGDDFDAQFPLYFNKTAELIKKSKLVLLHFSTAISFVVIYNKPFILLNSNLFKNSNINDYINDIKNFFGTSDKMMNEQFKRNSDLTTNNFRINSKKYQEFLDNYLKHPKSRNTTLTENLLALYSKLYTNNQDNGISI
jgi:hypothetical protein